MIKKNYIIKIPKLNFDGILPISYALDNIKYKVKGVYFLFLNHRIVYIGRSTHIYNRVVNHSKTDKQINGFLYICVKNDFKIQLTEVFYIKKYKPMYNLVYEVKGRIR